MYKTDEIFCNTFSCRFGKKRILTKIHYFHARKKQPCFWTFSLWYPERIAINSFLSPLSRSLDKKELLSFDQNNSQKRWNFQPQRDHGIKFSSKMRKIEMKRHRPIFVAWRRNEAQKTRFLSLLFRYVKEEFQKQLVFFSRIKAMNVGAQRCRHFKMSKKIS